MKRYSLGLYEKAMPSTLTWREKAEACKRAGFDRLEISIDETDEKLARIDKTGSDYRDFVRELQTCGVPIQSMCLSGHRRFSLGSRDPETRARGLDIMEKAIRLAADVGIRIIQLAGYDVYYEETGADTVAAFGENLERSVEMAACAGVVLGFETMETPFMDTVTKSMAYVDACNSPYLGVYPDIGNLCNAAVLYGTSFLEDLQRGAGHIFAAHLKETKPGHYREIPFGTGHTKYDVALDELKRQGVYFLTGEFWYIGAEDWEADLREANDFLREKIETSFSS